MKFTLHRLAWMLLLLIVVWGVGCQTLNFIQNKRNVLWNIVHQRCGTALDQKKDCLVMQPNYVVLRDIHGPVQTLIIPTQRITGIEDPALLKLNQPDYFAYAWQNRAILDLQNQKKIDPEYLSFTVNSKFGRTQDQLHIHSSCLRADVYQILKRNRGKMTAQWQPLPEKLLGHRYFAKRISLNSMFALSPFIDMAKNKNADAMLNMGQYGLGMVSISKNEAILLATRVNIHERNNASIEEIQDTHCELSRHEFTQ